MALMLVGLTIAKAQVTLEKNYEYSTYISKINATDYKYFIADAVNNQCRVYSTNHSLEKTINLSIPNSAWLYDVRHLTQDMFNPDDKLELLYVYYNWTTTNASTGDGYYTYYTRVINENGTVLMSSDGGLYSYILKDSDDEFKLFVYNYDYSTTNFKIWTNIYKIGGQPHFSSTFDVNDAEALSAFPNPSNDAVTIQYELPFGLEQAELVITNLRGIQVKSYTVDNTFQHLRLTKGDLLPGTYLYYLKGDGDVSEAKKLIML